MLAAADANGLVHDTFWTRVANHDRKNISTRTHAERSTRGKEKPTQKRQKFVLKFILHLIAQQFVIDVYEI